MADNNDILGNGVAQGCDPLFSVLVPVYNTESFVLECLNSIDNQSYRSFEAIVVNDGSTDDSLSICKKFCIEHPCEFRLINQDNKGLFEARRSAIREAHGKYCVFLDSDDCLRQDALEILYQTVQKGCPDVVAYRCSDSSDFSPTYASSFFSIDGLFNSEVSSVSNYRRALLETDRVNHIILKAVKRSRLAPVMEAPGRKLLMYEDKYEMALILDNVIQVETIPDILYFYRCNKGSITRRGFRASDYEDLKYVSSHLVLCMHRWGLTRCETNFYSLRLEQVYTEVNRLFSAHICGSKLEMIADSVRTDNFYLESCQKKALERLPLRKQYSLRLFSARKYSILRIFSRLIAFGRNVYKALPR